MNIDPINRESSVLRLLDKWPWDLGGVLIGGYAICAYGKPRYSEDVDIVVPASGLEKVKNFILGQELVLEKYSVPNPQNYCGKVFRYRKEYVTLDVLVGYVRDREARVDVPENWISERHRDIPVVTLTGRTQKKIPIARPEALWALKLQSGRDQDITDLFAISEVKMGLDEVVTLFRDLKSNTLVAKLMKTFEKTASQKLYEDSMSRLGTRRTDGNNKNWISFTNKIRYIVSESAK